MPDDHDDPWGGDATKRSIALQQRSDAVEHDSTPPTNPFAAHVEEKPKGVLLRRIEDGWVVLAHESDAEVMVHGGEYRPLVPDDKWNSNGTLTTSADAEQIAFAQREREQAIAKLLRQSEVKQDVEDDLGATVARLASMPPAERAALERQLIQAPVGAATGLVRGAQP